MNSYEITMLVDSCAIFIYSNRFVNTTIKQLFIIRMFYCVLRMYADTCNLDRVKNNRLLTALKRLKFATDNNLTNLLFFTKYVLLCFDNKL